MRRSPFGKLGGAGGGPYGPGLDLMAGMMAIFLMLLVDASGKNKETNNKAEVAITRLTWEVRLLEERQQHLQRRVSQAEGHREVVFPVQSTKQIECFDEGKATLYWSCRKRLVEKVGLLRERLSEGGSFTLVEVRAYASPEPGSVDPPGSDNYNRRLTWQRARAVSRLLVEEGIPETCVGELGLGRSHSQRIHRFQVADGQRGLEAWDRAVARGEIAPDADSERRIEVALVASAESICELVQPAGQSWR